MLPWISTQFPENLPKVLVCVCVCVRICEKTVTLSAFTEAFCNTNRQIILLLTQNTHTPNRAKKFLSIQGFKYHQNTII